MESSSFIEVDAVSDMMSIYKLKYRSDVIGDVQIAPVVKQSVIDWNKKNVRKYDGLGTP
jgi:hypothetical protein